MKTTFSMASGLAFFLYLRLASRALRILFFLLVIVRSLNQGRVTGERENALERFFVVGKEVAAGVATAVAASFPELIDQLVLIDSIGLVTGAEQDTSVQLRKAILACSNVSKNEKGEFVTFNL